MNKNNFKLKQFKDDVQKKIASLEELALTISDEAGKGTKKFTTWDKSPVAEEEINAIGMLHIDYVTPEIALAEIFGKLEVYYHLDLLLSLEDVDSRLDAFRLSCKAREEFTRFGLESKQINKKPNSDKDGK